MKARGEKNVKEDNIYRYIYIYEQTQVYNPRTEEEVRSGRRRNHRLSPKREASERARNESALRRPARFANIYIYIYLKTHSSAGRVQTGKRSFSVRRNPSPSASATYILEALVVRSTARIIAAAAAAVHSSSSSSSRQNSRCSRGKGRRWQTYFLLSGYDMYVHRIRRHEHAPGLWGSAIQQGVHTTSSRQWRK